MEETARIFVGTGKPETPKSPVTDAVRRAVSSWWERVGPKKIEDRFVQAHEAVLETFSTDERKKAHEKYLPAWKAAGKKWGIAATVIDFSLAGMGVLLSGYGLRNPHGTENLFSHTVIDRLRRFRITDPLARAYDSIFTVLNEQPGMAQAMSRYRARRVGNILSILPGLGSLGILLSGGPGHALATFAAITREQSWKALAHTSNYLDSEEAKLHAKKAKEAVGKGLKYVAEHPDEIRDTIEMVERQKREAATHKQKMQAMREESARAALEREFEAWKADEIARNKAYYELSGTEPTRDSFLDWKKNREESRRAAARAEGRKN